MQPTTTPCRRALVACLASLCAALAVPASAFAQGTQPAQSWPTRPVRLVVPFAAGGPADVLARFVGVKLSAELGQPVVIDNKSGAGGTLGASDVAKSTDGHSILFSSTGALVIVPAISKNLSYNPDRDLVAVGQVVITPSVFVVSARSPVKTLAELIAAARASPGKLNFASAGAGTTTQLGVELLKREAGVFMTHIPYRGAAPAITDVIGGSAELFAGDVPAVISFINGGQLRPLAVAAATRSPALPNVPTTAESGLKGVLSGTWYGVMAPARTPPEVVTKINAALNRVLARPETLAFFKEQGADAAGNSPQEFAAFIRTESRKWGDLARYAGVTLD